MPQLQTRAEATNYAETSLHADVLAYWRALAGAHPDRVALSSFGTSPGGRDLPLVVVSSHGVKTPAEARAKQLPVVLVICGIHAGEVEGKEASMMLARDLLGEAASDEDDHVLAKVVLVVVPLFNPDGNDALDAANRKLDLPKLEGQIGPAKVGTRVNGIGVNLNRDYLRQQALEMQLLQRHVMQVWEPDLTIDTHATNGSVHRFWMTYDVPHTHASGRPEPIAYMRTQVMPAVTRKLAEDHGLLAGWYGNFVEDERTLDARGEADPHAPVREGWMTYPHHPRFGGNYRGLVGRLDLLLECYSYLTFADRVRTTYATILETLRYIAAHGDEVVQLVAGCREPRAQIAVRAKLEPMPEPIEIATCTPRTLDGAPTTVTIPYFANFTGAVVVDRPPAYLVPADLAPHLAKHGLAIEPAPLRAEIEIATVAGFGTEGGRKILEAAQVGELTVTWRRETRAIDPGMRLVRTTGQYGAIAVYLCEPESDDGAVENGFVAPPALGDEFPIYRCYLA